MTKTALAELISKIRTNMALIEGSEVSETPTCKGIIAGLTKSITMAESLLEKDRQDLEAMWNDGLHYGYTSNPGDAQTRFDNTYTQQ